MWVLLYWSSTHLLINWTYKLFSMEDIFLIRELAVLSVEWAFLARLLDCLIFLKKKCIFMYKKCFICCVKVDLFCIINITTLLRFFYWQGEWGQGMWVFLCAHFWKFYCGCVFFFGKFCYHYLNAISNKSTWCCILNFYFNLLIYYLGNIFVMSNF